MIVKYWTLLWRYFYRSQPQFSRSVRRRKCPQILSFQFPAAATAPYMSCLVDLQTRPKFYCRAGEQSIHGQYNHIPPEGRGKLHKGRAPAHNANRLSGTKQRTPRVFRARHVLSLCSSTNCVVGNLAGPSGGSPRGKSRDHPRWPADMPHAPRRSFVPPSRWFCFGDSGAAQQIFVGRFSRFCRVVLGARLS